MSALCLPRPAHGLVRIFAEQHGHLKYSGGMYSMQTVQYFDSFVW